MSSFALPIGNAAAPQQESSASNFEVCRYRISDRWRNRSSTELVEFVTKLVTRSAINARLKAANERQQREAVGWLRAAFNSSNELRASGWKLKDVKVVPATVEDQYEIELALVSNGSGHEVVLSGSRAEFVDDIFGRN